MIQNETRFNALIDAALAQDFSGWDFSYLQGRWQEEAIAWDYAVIIQEHIQSVDNLLDMGTGGGEFLSSLAPLPKNTHATEAWQANVALARKRLRPLGVTVHGIEVKEPLPFQGNYFDVVINRHEWYDPTEVYRILKQDGLFITQQVGGKNDIELNQAISGELPDYVDWDMNLAREELLAANFEIVRAEEAATPLNFFDIGAIVYYLKVIEWQIPDFSVDKYRDQLGTIHNMIEKTGKFATTQERFLLITRKAQ